MARSRHIIGVELSRPTGFLFGLQDGHIIQCEPLKAGVLTQFTAFRQAIVSFIRQFLVVLLAFNGSTEKAHLTHRVNQHVVLDAVAFFLPL